MIQSRSLSGVHNTNASQIGWYRIRMLTLMLFADLTGLTLAIVVGHLILADPFNFLFFDPAELEHILVLGITLFMFMASRLYPGVGIDPAEEIKLVTQYSSSALIIGMVVNVVLHPVWLNATVTMITIWALSITNVLIMRWLIRIAAVQLGAWGKPVVVLARGEQAKEITQYFLQRRRLGFVPVLVATDICDPMAQNSLVPEIHFTSLIENPSTQLLKGVDTILIHGSFFGQDFMNRSYSRLSSMFQHIIFVSDMGWLEGASLAVRDFEGVIGIEACRNLLNPVSSIIKLIIDTIGSLVTILLFLPFLLLISALVKLDSSGPVFFTQPRVGVSGKVIRIFKFRTMMLNADQALDEYLKANPKAQAEWEETQKLCDDPRVTRLGKFLRKFSIDEIPQLINVLLGDMSLVGPRPIMVNQKILYGEGLAIYQSVRPGLTGLWQASGRNNTTFKERVRFDMYYVRHWSVWLDIYILFRTAWVVLTRNGAY